MNGLFGGDAGYRPRVRSVYYVRVYRHSPRRDVVNIGAEDTVYKDSARWRLWIGRRADTEDGVDAPQSRGAPPGALMLENVIHC